MRDENAARREQAQKIVTLRAKAVRTLQHAGYLGALNDPAADAVFSLAQELEAKAEVLEQAAKL